MLRFHLLGPFEAWRGEERIPASAWRTRQALAVLKFLLHERDRAVPAERLIEAAWPEAEPRAGLESLRVAITAVRRALEPDLRRGRTSRYIRTEPGHYRFASRGCEVDVDAFTRAAHVGAAEERRGDGAAALRAYREAVALYRGEYLADDPYAEWALAARERLRQSCLDVLERLARLLVSERQHEPAIATSCRDPRGGPEPERRISAAGALRDGRVPRPRR